MKCNFCKKEYSYDSVRRKYGTTHFADFGCCSENCYIKIMTGETPLPEIEENLK